MKCPKCQFDNRQGVKFCEQCGTKMELVCPNCGANIPLGSSFCGECGRDLREPKAAPAVDLSFEEKLEKIQRYLPDGLTEKILAQRGKIEGERKQVTVMFCDAEGFSPLSERLGPEKVYSIMDEVFEILIHRVIEYGGTVNKMTGDGIMALFGAPIALEDAPQRAIRSALAIQREIARFSDRTRAETGMPPIRMRIGIHTGPVVVGTLGNDLRVEFTAVGDTVNLASRMEGLAEPGAVYVTDETFNLTEGLFRFEALGERQVKGKEAPVKAYRVIAPSTRRTRFDVSAERGLTPFLGRERELELLIDGLDRAKSGRGQAFSIMGEAGVGKSRLLYEFRKAIANEDVTFLEGRCLSYSTSVPYHPVIDLLKSTFDIHEEDNDDRIRDSVKRGLKEMGVDEASTLPFILELLSVKDSGIDALGLSPEARKDRTLEALKRIVLKGCETRPLVMGVEDLHWVDRSSEDALKSLLEAISGAQVLLIFTYRPEFVHTWGTKSYHSQVNLMRLSNRETLAMAAHILGTEVIGSDLEELILEKTEGIPFFVEEFMKSLKDLRMIEWKDSGYYLAKDIQEVAIPSTIQEVIMARVDSLPEGAKSVLQTGSAIGREFSCELIKRVTGIPTPEMTPHLSVLRDSELLYERGIFPQATYIFRHSLTQEVAYDSLLLKKKQEIHQRIGKAIEELYPDRLEEFYEVLAHHYSRSDNPEKAYQYLKLSGDKAARAYSTSEVHRFYTQALEELKRVPGTEENKRRGIEIIHWMGISLMALWRLEESLEMLHEGERLAREVGDERGLVKIHGTMGHIYSLKGDLDTGRGYTELAYEFAKRTQDVELVAQTGFNICLSYFIAGHFFKLSQVAPEVIAILESTHRELDRYMSSLIIYPAVVSTYGMALGCLGDFDGGQKHCEKGLRTAIAFNDAGAMTHAEWMYGRLLTTRGDGESAMKHLQNALKYNRETETPYTLSVLQYMGEVYLYLGEMENALKNSQEILEDARRSGMPTVLTMLYIILGMIHYESGNLEDARSWIEEAVKARQNMYMESRARTWLGRIIARLDSSRVDEAEREIRQGIETLDELKLRPYICQGNLFLGELYADTGRTDEALDTLKKAEAEFEDMGMDYWLRRTQEVLERVQG